MAKKEEVKAEEIHDIQGALTSAEAFIEKNQKVILIGLGVVVLFVLAVLGFKTYYLEPRELAAQNEMYKSQNAFAVDSFKIALEGKGIESIGFIEIASEYGFTATGKLANAYAGICLFKLGKYEDAIEYLNKYSSKETHLGVTVQGLIGDCYVNLGQNEDAIKAFEKAIGCDDNVLSPMYLKKLGFVYESIKDNEKAEKAYTSIKEKYPKSAEAAEVDKYLARVQK
jgi:tetratricopeptide (TPR) repeat protein